MIVRGTPLDREALAALPRTPLQRGGLRSADVWRVDGPGGPFVVKDFAARPRWLRATLGRWLVRRELRVYRALAGIPAVPRLLGRVDAFAFAIEYRPGRHLSRRIAAALPPDFVPRLEAAVRAMHARRIVHLDLRHRDNVLVDGQGAPVLLDFASALRVPALGGLGAPLLRALARIDERALAKWRGRFQAPSPEPGTGTPRSGAGAPGDTAASGRRGASRPT